MEQSWINKVSAGALNFAETTVKGFHAIPKPDANPFKEMPSMHRLMNVVGMAAGFSSVQYLSNIIFGCKINGSNCEEIHKEKVPKPLRFLHGIVQYNPFSDAPRDQWLKVVHQMLPAIGGAAGAIKGSDLFFQDFNKRGREFKQWMSQPTLNPIQADSAARYMQGQAWTKFAAVFAGASAASGLGPLFGFGLNEAFKSKNGAQVVFTKTLRNLMGNPSKLGFAPEKGMAEVLKGMEMAMRDGDAEGFGQRLVETGIAPLVKMTPEREKAVVKRLSQIFERNAMQVTDKKEIPALAKYMEGQVMQVIAETDIPDLKVGEGGITTSMIKLFPGVKKSLTELRSRIPEQPLLPLPPSHSRG